MRNITKIINIGNQSIGGNSPILIQSMTTTRTQDIDGTVNQIAKLFDAGCQIARVAVPDLEAATAIKEIKSRISLPLVADIHFDYRLAIESIKSGADKIRINPGNIGSTERLKMVVDAAKERQIPIRVGVNSGSLEKDILQKYGKPNAAALVESALRNVSMIEAMGYNNLVISIKSSDVVKTIESYMEIAKKTDYPLHLGITEAGTKYTGTIKSAVGIGTLLYAGIGDTIRVSLTGDPVEEIYAAIEILKSLKLYKSGIEIISCPTCGRCNVNLAATAEMVEKAVKEIKTDKPIKIAVMGCGVNGPGEAREADIGIAGGDGDFLLFIKGEIIRKIPQQNIVAELMAEVNNLL